MQIFGNFTRFLVRCVHLFNFLKFALEISFQLTGVLIDGRKASEKVSKDGELPATSTLGW